METKTAEYNPFALLDEQPVQPAFLVRDTDPYQAIARHEARMKAQGIELPGLTGRATTRTIAGKSAVGIAFDQQEAVLAALYGEYAHRYWADKWAELYRRWAMSDIFETILADGNADPRRVRKVLGPILMELNPREDELGRALLMIFRAWQLRQQVVIEQRPMSLIPVVGGAVLGSTPNFTPVVKRMAKDRWRIGWPGDTIDPCIIVEADVRGAVQQAMVEFNKRYFVEQRGYFEVKNTEALLAIPEPDHIYFIPWGSKLRVEKKLPMGNDGAFLEEISHNHLFRLRLPDGQQFILRSDPQTAVRHSIEATTNGKVSLPPVPTPAEIRQAYLAEMSGRRVESVMKVTSPQPVHLKPFPFLESEKLYVICLESPAARREIYVAWTKENDKMALSVASGSLFPTRAVLVINRTNDKLAIIPVSYKTQKPDVQHRWAETPIADLNPDSEVDREALAGWAAWVWFQKAEQYLPGKGD